MRRFAPATLAAAVALAIASTGAIAQTTLRVVPTATATGTNGSTVTTGTGNTTASATGTNGSTVTTGTSGTTPSDSGTSVVSSGTLATTPTATPTNNTVTTGNSTAASRTPVTTDVNSLPPEFRRDPAETASALGTSPGQTSSGTAAGNSSTGLNAPSENLGTGNQLDGTTGALNAGVIVPGAGIAGTSGVAASNGVSNGVNANGERVMGGVGSGNVISNNATTPTPLFDLAARQGMAKEQRRRARGEEPRVYGIAPRTDRDLTHQMADDPVIRY